MKSTARRLRHASLGLLFLSILSPGFLRAAEPWEEALNRMPLSKPVTEINRTNCLDLLLGSFGSNNVVKALIFMPGATDEWFMPHASKVAVTNANPTLLDVVNALAANTRIHPLFRPPFLILHTALDQTEPDITIQDQVTAEKIRQAKFAPHLVFYDRDWDYVAPYLRKYLKTTMRPWRYTHDSWHFYRHSFAEWNLTGWEALEATALAARTACVIEHKKVVFRVDRRLPDTKAESRNEP